MFGYLCIQVRFHKKRIPELLDVWEKNVSVLNPANPVILSENSQALKKGPASNAPEKGI
jgi:hypothetical protein